MVTVVVMALDSELEAESEMVLVEAESDDEVDVFADGPESLVRLMIERIVTGIDSDLGSFVRLNLTLHISNSRDLLLHDLGNQIIETEVGQCRRIELALDVGHVAQVDVQRGQRLLDRTLKLNIDVRQAGVEDFKYQRVSFCW